VRHIQSRLTCPDVDVQEMQMTMEQTCRSQSRVKEREVGITTARGNTSTSGAADAYENLAQILYRYSENQFDRRWRSIRFAVGLP
jgi:hypothetical protein